MYKEYVYTDGKAVIKNDDGTNSIIEYNDDIEKRLICENIIEYLETTLNNLREKLQQKQKYVKDIKMINILTMPFFVGVTFSISILLNSMMGTNDKIIETFFGMMNAGAFNTITFTVLFSLIGGLFTSAGLLSSSMAKKEKKELIYIIKGLEKELILKNKDLKVLKECENKEKESDVKKHPEIKEISNKEELEKIKNILLIYKNYGYNCNKYLRFYNEGILDEKLQKKHYSSNAINIIKELIEEDLNQKLSLEKESNHQKRKIPTKKN